MIGSIANEAAKTIAEKSESVILTKWQPWSGLS